MPQYSYTTVEELQKSFPEAFKENGDVDFTGIKGAENIARLPENWEVKRDLTLSNMPFLREVPKNLSVGRSFRLVRCDAISILPSDLSVRNDQNTDLGYGIVVIACSSLAIIEDNTPTPYSMHIKDCPKLSSLPKLMKGGTLTVSGCNSLITLPDVVDVCQLTLIDNPLLNSLPRQLAFTSGVSISGCPQIQNFPEMEDFHGVIIANGRDQVSCEVASTVNLQNIVDTIDTGGDITVKGSGKFQLRSI